MIVKTEGNEVFSVINIPDGKDNYARLNVDQAKKCANIRKGLLASESIYIAMDKIWRCVMRVYNGGRLSCYDRVDGKIIVVNFEKISNSIFKVISANYVEDR